MPSPLAENVGGDAKRDALLRGLTRLIWMAAFTLAGVGAIVATLFF